MERRRTCAGRRPVSSDDKARTIGYCYRATVVAVLGAVLTLRADAQTTSSSSTSSKTLPPFKNLTFVTEPPGEVVVARGTNVLLPCAAPYYGPSPTVISWTFRGELINILGGAQSRRIILENGSLIISRAGSDDQHPDDGMYRCIAEVPGDNGNYLRFATPQIKLEISSMSNKFVRDPQSLALAFGSTAMLVCQIAAKPPPLYSWWRGEGSAAVEVLSSGNRVTSYAHDGVLEIASLSTDDLGDYRCRATSIAGGQRMERASVPARLSLRTSTAADVSALPEFSIRPWDVAVREGATATLFCAANSAAGSVTQTNIIWLKDGSTVDTVYENNGRLSIVGTGSLRIANATEADTGVYTCRADNSVDSVDSDAILTVLVPPRFVVQPSNVRAVAGRDVELECSVYGVPPPRVYWLRDSEELLDGSSDYMRIVVGRGLLINGVTESDTAFYQCVAESEVGRIHAIAQLAVQPDSAGGEAEGETSARPASAANAGRPAGGGGELPPGRPRELAAASVSSSVVSLVWQPPDEPVEVVSYRVVSKESDSRRVRTANVTTASFSQASLKPNTQYLFHVYAVDRDGRQSSLPAELTVRTRPEIPVPPAPTEFAAVAISSTEVRLSWAAPRSSATSAASPIRSYRVYYYTRQQTGEQSLNTTSLSLLLDRLLVHADYYVRVAAINAVGEGVPSEEIHVRTYSDVPGAPPQNLTAEPTGVRSVLVQWSPPPANRQNGVITGYKVRYKQLDRPSTAAAGVTVTTDGSARSYEITGLQPGEAYNVRIAATNVNGTGEYTAWVTVNTYSVDVDESRPPGKPLYIQVKTFATEMIVSWGPPSGNVMIRGYRLSYGPITPDERSVELGPTERQCTLRNLRPTQSYVMELKAYNSAGVGFPIMAQDFTRDAQSVTVGGGGSGAGSDGAAELAPPLQVKATVLSSTTVLVTWHDNSLGANQRVMDNRYYTIKYNSLTGSVRKPKTVNSTELSYIVDGLLPNTKYEFAVKVVKGSRESVFSLNQRNTTLEAAPASAPRDLTITASESSPTEVVVSWQPPLKANGRIINYLLYYATDSRMDIRHWVMETIPGDRLNERVRPVTPDTTYFFKMEAHNAKGRGPLTGTGVFRTPKADGTGGGGIAVNQGLRPSQVPDLSGPLNKGKGTSEFGATAAPPSKSGSAGEISQDVMWIIIGCVAAITLVAIAALAILCRRRLIGKASSGNRAGGKYGDKDAAGDASANQPPDLFKHHEQIPLKHGQHLASVDIRPGEEMVRMLDPNQRSYDVDDHASVSVGDTFIDTYSSLGRATRPVLVTPQGLCREGMPRAAVQPMSVASTSLELNGSRHAYPRTPYHQQYGSGARVYVGDSSSAAPLLGSANVRPQASSPYTAYSLNPYSPGGDRSDSDSLKKTPRSAALSARSDLSSMGVSRHEALPLPKTLSSEQLSEDVVNLDGIMKDLNAIKMQIES